MELRVGDEAPLFTLPDQNGDEHALKDYRGQWVLLYFYPEDDTPGCTKEACAIRDVHADFESVNTVVLGVSVDLVDSHKQFADKYALPFTLLSDTSKGVAYAYDVWEKNGVRRTSFLIDPSGKISKIYDDVNPAQHAGQVLRDLKKPRG